MVALVFAVFSLACLILGGGASLKAARANPPDATLSYFGGLLIVAGLATLGVALVHHGVVPFRPAMLLNP